MNRLFLLTAAAAVSAMLGGCVSALKVELRGAVPANGTFYMAGSGGGLATHERAVRDRLIGRGLAEHEDGTYLVQAALSERERAAGMAVSSGSQWLHPPGHGAGHVVQLSVTMTQVASGSEVFHATSSRRSGRVDAKIIDQLVDAVFARLMKVSSGTSAGAPG